MAASSGIERQNGIILPFRGVVPIIDASVFVAHGAVVIGDVEIGRDSSIWFNCVVRGDVNSIRIGERTNIQDGSVVHVTSGKYAVRIGSDVTIGHGVIVHGSTVHDHCLLGMGSRILDNAVIEAYSIIGAGAVVMQDEIVSEGSFFAGVPARFIRKVTDDERRYIETSAVNYCRYVRMYHA